IRAVDVSTRAIASAKKGIYAAERLGALPFPLIKKYFQPAGSGGFQVKTEVRRVVEFARVNVVEPLAEMRVYPLIFCRNMMIYLDKPTQERLISQLTQFIEPGGYLFIGHSESLMGVRHTLEYVQPSIYRKPGALAR